jgi:apolipoprotein N-acyltransferase
VRVRDAIVAACAGTVLALAFPKVGAAWCAPVGAAALFWMWRDASWKRAFGLGWFAGLVFFSIACSWAGYTVGPYLGWFAPGVVLLPAAYLGLFFGAAGAATAWAVRRAPRWAGPLVFAAAFAFFEWLRSIGTFGVPFGELGTAQVGTPLAPLAAYAGTLGVTFAVCVLGGALADGLLRRAWKPLAAHALAIAATCALAWAFWPARFAAPATVRVAAVQGDIAQSLKWTASSVVVAIDRYEAQTRALAPFHPQLVVWPETAVAEWLNRDPRTMTRLAGLSRDLQTTLVVGAQRAEPPNAIYNSLYIFDRGDLAGVYDKRQMVPVVETMPPFLAWLPYVGELGGGAMSAGTRDAVYPAGGLIFAPLICWETGFADVAHAQVRAGAQVLVVATDDAWFGDTAGPPMHAQISQMTAIENGMWLVRAASTGVSGIIAPDGSYAARADMDAQAVVRGTIGLPPGSPFARTGPLPVAVLMALLYAGLSRRRRPDA